MRNGLRVVSEQIAGVRSISLGVWVDVGSRCEQLDQGGLSHFVEHLVFKGTRKRNARQIAASLESIGGGLNAFTTREQTCFTARVLDDLLPDAVDILADITCQPTMTAINMNRERQVICEEIKESLDNPSDRIHDLFAETFWGGHPLGRPIMGSAELIQSVPRAKLNKYYRNNYRTGSIVIAAAGSVSHNHLLKLVREKFDLPEGEANQPPPAERPGGTRVRMVSDDSSQTQFCLGFPGLGYSSTDKFALMLLASHLGGGMSSVLFQKIREQRGLAYSVFSFIDVYKDDGILGFYLGTDASHLREAYDLILIECRRLKNRRLPGLTLSTIKAQVKGQLMLGMESTSARMQRLGRMELLCGSYQNLEESLAAIDAVTASDLTRLANEIIREQDMAITALGPADSKMFDDVSGG